MLAGIHLGMNVRPHDANPVLETLIDRLHERDRLRVWSLVITVFGDAIVPRGGRVALSVLQDALGRLRVEPGALRTAMSRLAADGWVIREREGRRSFFRLDERGRHAFDLATRRIYAAAPPAWDGKWTVAIAPPGAAVREAGELRELGFLPVGGGVHLRPETAESPDASAALAEMLVVHGESVDHPEAFRTLWPSDVVAHAYEDFTTAFRPLASALAHGWTPAPLAAFAARTLVIHDWRRVVLRDPGLPRSLMPDGSPGEDARALMHGIYDALRAPSEAWLGDQGI